MKIAVHLVTVLLIVVGQIQQKVLPFDDFMRGLKDAHSAAFVRRPGAAVKDAQAFEQMRDYLLHLYEGMHVRQSYRVGSQVIDCVPVNEQPSLRQSTKGIAAPPPGAADKDSGDGCAEGTIPMRRITLDELIRFPTLDDYLHKQSHEYVPVPPEHEPTK